MEKCARQSEEMVTPVWHVESVSPFFDGSSDSTMRLKGLELMLKISLNDSTQSPYDMATRRQQLRENSGHSITRVKLNHNKES